MGFLEKIFGKRNNENIPQNQEENTPTANTQPISNSTQNENKEDEAHNYISQYTTLYSQAQQLNNTVTEYSNKKNESKESIKQDEVHKLHLAYLSLMRKLIDLEAKVQAFSGKLNILDSKDASIQINLYNKSAQASFELNKVRDKLTPLENEVLKNLGIDLSNKSESR